MSMELTPSTRIGSYYCTCITCIFHFFSRSCQHIIHFPEDLHFLLKSKAVLPYLSSKQQGQKFIAKMLQQVSIFSYMTSHKSSLKESTTSELGYNFPLMAA